ncbi:MAG: TRAP transporter small permease [Gemmatimonadetes bacterium]|nr:TRAP transporter small permease [Gemmatimonadota bacterium]
MARWLARVTTHVEQALGWILVGLMSVMVVDVTWQVTSRFVFRSPSSFTEELAGFLLIWIGLLGAAYGVRTRAHLGIDLLVERMGGGWRKAAETLAHLLVVCFALATMVGGGLWLVRLAFRLEQVSASLGVRMGFVYLALPLSGVLVSLFSLEALARTVSSIDSAEEAVGPKPAPGGSDGAET